jgi:hexokinase
MQVLFILRCVNMQLSDSTPTLSTSLASFQSAHPAAVPPTYLDLLFLQQVSALISRRAAAYLATGIHALCSLRTRAEGLTPVTAGHVSIG